MNDRELLESAARAAGYQIERWSEIGQFLIVVPTDGPINFTEWSPLTDDAAAMRLAVKLDISLRQKFAMVQAEFPWTDEKFNERRVICEPVLDDACGPSRRAIVRAAAEIGKRVDAPLMRAD